MKNTKSRKISVEKVENKKKVHKTFGDLFQEEVSFLFRKIYNKEEIEKLKRFDLNKMKRSKETKVMKSMRSMELESPTFRQVESDGED